MNNKAILDFLGFNLKELLGIVLAGITLGIMDSLTIFFASRLFPAVLNQELVFGLNSNEQVIVFIAFLLLALFGRVVLLKYVLHKSYSKESIIGRSYLQSFIDSGSIEETSEDTIVKDVISEAEVATKAFVVPGIQFVIASLNVLILLGVLTFMISIDVIFLVVLIGFLYVVLAKFSRPVLKREGEVRQTQINNKYLAVSDIVNFKNGFLFYDNRERFQLRYSDATNRVAVSQAKSQVFARAPRYVIELLIIGGAAIGALTLQGDPNFGELGVTLILILKLIPATQLAYNNFSLAQYNNITLKRLIAKMRNFKDSQFNEITPCKDRIIEIRGLIIELDKNHISYPDFRFDWVSEDIYKVTGESGSGKSTLLKSLVGIVNPSKGSVISGYHDNIIYLSQNPELLNLSILENLTLLDQFEKNSIERALEVLELETNILSQERNELSGGQIQRIVLARALLTGKECLVLDEALSGVSEEMEKRIIVRLCKELNKKIIYVSHRELDLGLNTTFMKL